MDLAGGKHQFREEGVQFRRLGEDSQPFRVVALELMEY
jgi:hypothetical protein